MAERVERRLAAISAADVVGYSRLMEADGEGTHARLKAHRTDLVEPIIDGYRGRIVKLTGDGALVEFPSVVDAVRCAADLQRGMAERNVDSPKNERIIFRIGVNIGDVIDDEDDIYGDGVNIAARLEGIAPPGGVCISEDAFRQVEGKVEYGFEDLGEHQVKNIERPVHVYQMALEPAAGNLARLGSPKQQFSRLRWLAAATVFICVAATTIWWQLRAPDRLSRISERATLELPDRPSIAGLPFSNLSEDQAQEYFAEGMADDIITDLSRISGLFVIARNSSFQFKGRNVDVRQIADELGVRFVLEGSVRRASGRVRINTQLIDAQTGGHVWAERFDSEINDVFELQNQVTQRVVNSLAVTLTADEQETRRGGETENPSAHDAFLRGWAHYQRNTPQDYAKAIPYLEQAIEQDPKYVRAFTTLAAVYWNAFANGRTSRGGEWVRSLDESLTGTFALAANYMEEANEPESDPLAYQVSSGMLIFQGRYDEAINQAERAIGLDRNDPAGHEAFGKALIFAGQPQRGIDSLRTAMRLDPHYAQNYQHWLGVAEFGLERFEEAATSLAEASQRNPDDERILIPLAATYGMLERKDEARQAVDRLNKLRKLESERLVQSGLTPGIDLFMVGPLTLQDMELWPFKQQSDRERLREGLKRIDVPARGSDDEESPREVAGAETVDVATARALFDRGVKFVDVRGPSWNLGHIPGAAHLFLEETFDELSFASFAAKTDEVVIYCMGPSCLLSSEACEQAVSWGYKKIYYFREGFPTWQAAGHPIELPD